MTEQPQPLDPKDKALLTAVVNGHKIRVAARSIGVSESYAKTRLSKLYIRLGARSAAQAIVIMLKAGLVSLDEL